MSTKVRKESRIKKCIKAPIRVLIKARDCYVQSMTDCSGRIGYGGMSSGPAVPQLSSLPRSFSVNSSVSSGDEDFRELMRIASKRSTLVNEVELEHLRRQSPINNGVNVNVVPRSRSVAIGRIDEDKPCDFGEDVLVKTDVYPRASSRSCAVSSRQIPNK
ncbi:PREDICTED: uncharacterized protein LOC109241239 [Nicotiana attenuata]|uniref:Uncharacterized protein n=1 Tax=Nicotiana attenuata TaxID=49451 RepID=A0A1J6JET4_NICAT|nr:PREDICTED: uncharacterized protein LOC109241239 [Nicotiana attenuata]OIT08199.1 hypothetical protein A4A49_18526 [Nicotiana attenuata]